MFDISPEKLLVVAAVAMLVLGPDRLPGLARRAARLRTDLRRLTAEVDPRTLQAIRDPRAALRPFVDPVHTATDSLRALVDQAAAPGPAGAARPAERTDAAMPVPDDPSIN